MNEVEQMERVMLLQTGEVKELLKKRRHYEYKLQKRNKEKTDFLEYIQYESNLLSLLRLRRETTGYSHKQAEIEGSIKTRSVSEWRRDWSVIIYLQDQQTVQDPGAKEPAGRVRVVVTHSVPQDQRVGRRSVQAVHQAAPGPQRQARPLD